MQLPFGELPASSVSYGSTRHLPVSRGQQELEQMAVSVAQRDFGSILEGVVATVAPVMRGVLVRYPWGRIEAFFDGSDPRAFTNADPASADRLIVKPLSLIEQFRLNHLSDVEVIRTHLMTADPSTRWYLSSPAQRRQYMAANYVQSFEQNGAAISGFKAVGPPTTLGTTGSTQRGPDSREYTVSYHSAITDRFRAPPGTREFVCELGRDGLGKPWRMFGCYTGPGVE